MPNIVMARSSERISVPSGQSITIFTQGGATISQDIGGVVTQLGTVTSAQQMFGPFGSATTVVIESVGAPVLYAFGVSPIIREMIGNRVQRTPIAINAAGAIPASALANGLISSNSLLGITCTLPTGTAMEDVSGFRIDDSFDWSVMAVGLFGFTVGASTGHTIVGNASVGSGSSGEFRTRKTAANTFVTYRIG